MNLGILGRIQIIHLDAANSISQKNRSSEPLTPFSIVIIFAFRILIFYQISVNDLNLDRCP